MASVEEQVAKLTDIDLYSQHTIPLLEDCVRHQVSRAFQRE